MQSSLVSLQMNLPGAVVYICNPGTQEAEAGASQVLGEPGYKTAAYL